MDHNSQDQRHILESMIKVYLTNGWHNLLCSMIGLMPQVPPLHPILSSPCPNLWGRCRSRQFRRSAKPAIMKSVE